MEKEEEAEIQVVVEVLEISRAKLNIDEYCQRKSDEVAELMQQTNRDGIPPNKEDIEDIEVFEESPSFGPLSKVDNMEQVEALLLEMEENKYEAPKDLYHIIFDGLLLDSSTTITTIGLAKIKALFQRDGRGECRYHQLGLVRKYSSVLHNHNDCIVLVSASIEMGRQLHFKLLYDVKAQQGEMKILPNFANFTEEGDKLEVLPASPMLELRILLRRLHRKVQQVINKKVNAPLFGTTNLVMRPSLLALNLALSIDPVRASLGMFEPSPTRLCRKSMASPDLKAMSDGLVGGSLCALGVSSLLLRSSTRGKTTKEERTRSGTLCHGALMNFIWLASIIANPVGKLAIMLMCLASVVVFFPLSALASPMSD
eukprot:Gb_31738 [translate_table: standard]